MLPPALWWLEESGPARWEGLDLARLRMDQAYVRVHNEADEDPLWLYSLSEDCQDCPYRRWSEVSGEGPHVLTVDTARTSTWRVYTNGDNATVSEDDTRWASCEVPAALGEFGVYDLHVNGSDCMLRTARQPANVLFPLASVAVALLALAVLHGAVSLVASCVGRRQRRRREARRASAAPPTQPVDVNEYKAQLNGNGGRKLLDPDSPSASPSPSSSLAPSAPAPTPARRRVRSVDVVRGISIVLMMFVNHGAGGYWFLGHATWDGLYVGDLVFPWFLWIMGVCIPLSVRPQLARGASRCRLLLTVFRRSLVLFALGVALCSLSSSRLESLRIMGVLQRLGVAYLVVASLAVLMTPRRWGAAAVDLGAPGSGAKGRSPGALADVVVLLPQWVVVLALAAAHVVAFLLLDVPGCPRGYMGPGGVHLDGAHPNCTGGAAGYVDRLVLGEEHLYQTPGAHAVYGSGPFDPEGLLGCLSSVLQVFLGVQAGSALVTFPSWRARLARWFAWAVLLAAAGVCGWYFGGVPVNKSLWTLPFVLLTSSLALLLLCGCYLLVDVWRCWTGSPFLYPGMNALVMYVGHQLCYQLFPFHWQLGPMNTHLMLLLENVWGTLLWILVAVFLYRRKVFISV
ncbi:Heparan-alpha-glucosaminide N-acetyltransferase [Frankliniella fusca]|uniref:Heparan-alpha-glucosaminide N-acetyltransferase n=1 Tax=Frankliniella fusca TaxID=407009 RepID=A0AAE1LDV4_9NEOP|nr:Heparan-alpha-glucosaminide N-acetyltransferase [Frankliniella fusca]